jgi:hypothetical protein
MKTCLIILFSLLPIFIYCQPSSISCDYTTEITDSNYVIVWRKCKGCKLEKHLEGPVEPGVVITKHNYGYYRTGVWKQYDIQDGSSFTTTEYHKGVRLGEYKVGEPNESFITYKIVKDGVSTITYSNKHNHITQIDSFDLNDPEKTTEKIFYDIRGNVILKEIWKNGIKVS